MRTNTAICAVLSFLGVAVSVATPARADILTTCPDCDGSRYAITYYLDSDNGTTSIFDVTLLADTSGNTLGATKIDAVAIGLNGGTVESAMDAAPNGAGNWTAQPDGISAAGCHGSNSAFICASANSDSFAASTPNASTATTPYEWTFDVDVPDSTPGGAASIFSAGGDVKVHYDSVQGHLVSDLFDFHDAPPPSEVPEPQWAMLFPALLLGTALVRRSLKLRKSGSL